MSISYWEKKHFTSYQTIIVGAGIAGLFTAIFLKRKYPIERLLIVDKDVFPSATTKNAGFACMGSITELEDDLQHSSEAEIISLFEKRYLGLQIMCNELGDEQIGYHENGSYELLEAASASALDKITFWNERLKSINGKDFFAAGDISQHSFAGYAAVINNLQEAEIDSGKLWRTLKQKASEMGVEFMQGVAVQSYEKILSAYKLTTSMEFDLSANRLIFCTNAFTKHLLPAIDITPGRGQVLVTKPITDLTFKGIYHFDRGYYYFREIDGRVLLGGGRQLDKLGETTNAQGSNDLILADLQTKLKNNILPNTPFEIDYGWSGIMGFSNTKNPIMKEVENQLFVLAGFGGMGVALAPFMAQELVGLID